MVGAVFRTAARSRVRQISLRRGAAIHVAVVAIAGWHALHRSDASALPLFGAILLVLGIVEGAAFVGWRLTQVPKSRSLEFLLASPVPPQRLFAAEAAVGLVRSAMLTLTGLPVLLVLAGYGRLLWTDVPVLLVMPWTWGAVTGLGLTVWAYETPWLRRWGERVVLLVILLYLGIGVLIGENLRSALASLPHSTGTALWQLLLAVHHYNPFTVLSVWLGPGPAWSWPEMVTLQIVAAALVVGLWWRSGCRFQGHFHDRHYRPIEAKHRGRRGTIGSRPLSWWAVRRVMEYSGRVNIWLAGGFGVLFAIYTMAGPAWPSWLGRSVFDIVDRAGGGVAGLATAMVLLAAVPAAFQYGLWDSSTQDRCRRLELLLATELDGTDYWLAAAAAAWRRGRGYAAVAVLLMLASVVAGTATGMQVLAALAAAVILWGFCFAVGYRAFTRGIRANGLGMLLTIGLPLLSWVLWQMGLPRWAALLPPGAIFSVLRSPPDPTWFVGPVVFAAATLYVSRWAIRRCLTDLRAWYSRNHGLKAAD